MIIVLKSYNLWQPKLKRLNRNTIHLFIQSFIFQFLFIQSNKLAIKLKSIKTLSFNEGGGSRDAD
jgi:hypothetical protein